MEREHSGYLSGFLHSDSVFDARRKCPCDRFIGFEVKYLRSVTEAVSNF
jgi:hypothetical protein